MKLIPKHQFGGFIFSDPSEDDYKDAQKLLQQSGYYTGNIDGIWGKQSDKAWADFQNNQTDKSNDYTDYTKRRWFGFAAPYPVVNKVKKQLEQKSTDINQAYKKEREQHPYKYFSGKKKEEYNITPAPTTTKKPQDWPENFTIGDEAYKDLSALKNGIDTLNLKDHLKAGHGIGLTTSQNAAMAGNIAVESLFNPGIREVGNSKSGMGYLQLTDKDKKQHYRNWYKNVWLTQNAETPEKEWASAPQIAYNTKMFKDYISKPFGSIYDYYSVFNDKNEQVHVLPTPTGTTYDTFKISPKKHINSPTASPEQKAYMFSATYENHGDPSSIEPREKIARIIYNVMSANGLK